MMSTLDPTAKGEWGVMNAQQMVEHMADSISYATGKNNQKLHTPPDLVARYKEFAMSDKEFKPNTPNALLPDVPPPASKGNVKDAVAAYEAQVAAYVDYFEKNKGGVLTNPFFGDLNFEEWLHLFAKHARHHARQFRLM